MPKRKSNPCATTPISLSSLDAALDILACETFTRLDQLSAKFEAAAGCKLNDGVVKGRWLEAINRYWVMKGMDGLSCGGKRAQVDEDEVKMDQNEDDGAADTEKRDSSGRILAEPHPGPVTIHRLCSDEEHEWRKWTPRVGDVVLCELEKDGIWPGKIIDKRTFFQGRTVPKGNHFFPVRIYSETFEPTLTIKSRLIPFSLRCSPPLLAAPALQSAYHHAENPASFDSKAEIRESQAAHSRTHPGVGDEIDRDKLKAQKQAWNKTVNWVMNERRGEKMRTLMEEREKRLREVAKVEFEAEGAASDECGPKKQRTAGLSAPKPTFNRSSSSEASTSLQTPTASIFGPLATAPPNTPRRTDSPTLAGFIRPSLSAPQRPQSPRKFDRKTRLYTGVGEHSPRGNRYGTYTPPRILPSGDETAPNSSPVPTGTFDFVSAFGPNARTVVTNGLVRKASLEAVKEEDGDDQGWMVVGRKSRSKRSGSLPCGDKQGMDASIETGREEMMVS